MQVEVVVNGGMGQLDLSVARAASTFSFLTFHEPTRPRAFKYLCCRLHGNRVTRYGTVAVNSIVFNPHFPLDFELMKQLKPTLEQFKVGYTSHSALI